MRASLRAAAGPANSLATSASWLLALAGWLSESGATCAPTLAVLFALLRCHLFPAFFHALLHLPPHIGAAGTVQSMSPEEDAAQRENPKRLPEGDLVPSERSEEHT